MDMEGRGIKLVHDSNKTAETILAGTDSLPVKLS